MDERYVCNLVQIWVGECNESRLFKDACYLLQILVDCSLNHGSDQSGIYATKYGQALESVQRYEDAVNIYAEIAEEHFVPKHSKCATEIFRGFAGLAFFKAQSYVRAEEEYIASLRAHYKILFSYIRNKIELIYPSKDNIEEARAQFLKDFKVKAKVSSQK